MMIFYKLAGLLGPVFFRPDEPIASDTLHVTKQQYLPYAYALSNRRLRILTSLLIGTGIFTASAVVSASSLVLPSRDLKAGPFTVYAQVAATPASRQRGLMFRESLAPNHGMLFAFSLPHYHCFWMKNTPLPLSIAFIDADGAIVNIEHMQPFSETQWCAKKPVPYALEMQQGWFAAHDIGIGHIITGLPPLPRE